MGGKIVAVNAGPRKGWNTDTLVDEAIKDAESKGRRLRSSICSNLKNIPAASPASGAKESGTEGGAYAGTDLLRCLTPSDPQTASSSDLPTVWVR